VARSHARLVSESFVDVEGSSVLGFGCGQVAAVARDVAETPMRDGHAGFVSECLLDLGSAARGGFGHRRRASSLVEWGFSMLEVRSESLWPRYTL
jgi:hypothetical protein